ncbi:hypothetical protein [Stenotrophomonas maltophilia]|jgi:hypothetical protein|uniref:hypothetical protein n=1 Tax=Stenotrophomonas maltophilia TaxID=40324 RepID=UPI0002B8B983|nr:hypothetical protein [Stenotrophomonas maltophilia]EMF62535.1 Hypothetical protein EPM1_0211 [Stenotrophomonas maltophilia EPM1]KWV43644.1 hypothetical protein AS591_21865 [Stenotrophomonas maltophilia]MBA0461023.1 hypothetical protein [Stenotrophomonas maltophilia]MBC8773472.1 hypothetical protein [Stenotrophomonas maltophilia]MBH1609649.1 hypothetical protein [Stenotrophomonas maltophilia]
MDDMTSTSSPLRTTRRDLAIAGILVLLLGASLVSVAKRSDYQTSLLRQAFAEDAGFDASVPREVVDARDLLRAQPIAPSLLSLGRGLKDDPLIQQRMWEALYPVRFSDTDTPQRLLRAGDPLVDQCHVQGRSGDVVLADCR